MVNDIDFNLTDYNILTPEMCFALRELLGLTHEQLVRAAGMSGKRSQSARIRRYEAGTAHDWSERNKRVLCHAFERHGVQFIHGQAGTIVALHDEPIAYDNEPKDWLKKLIHMKPSAWRQTRWDFDLSQKQAARLSGVWQFSISRIENRHGSEPLFKLRHKALLLDVYEVRLGVLHKTIPSELLRHLQR